MEKNALGGRLGARLAGLLAPVNRAATSVGRTWNRMPSVGRGAGYLAGGAGLSTAEYAGINHLPGLEDFKPSLYERLGMALVHAGGVGGLRRLGSMGTPGRIFTGGATLAATPIAAYARTGLERGSKVLKNLEVVTGDMKGHSDRANEMGGMIKAFFTGEKVTLPPEDPGKPDVRREVKMPVSLPQSMQRLDDLTQLLRQSVPSVVGTGLGYLAGGKATEAFLPTNDEAKRRRRLVLGQLLGAGLGGFGGYLAGGGAAPKAPW